MTTVMDEAAGAFLCSEEQSQRLTIPVLCHHTFAPVSPYILMIDPWDEMVEMQPVQGSDNAVDAREVMRRKQSFRLD